MFQDLPETNPTRNPKKNKALMAAAAVHVLLVAGIILIQMALPGKIGEIQLLTTLHMAPPPSPPPALGPVPVPEAARRSEQRAASRVRSTIVRQEPTPPPTSTPPELIAPTAVPEGIAEIIEAEPGAGGVIGGLPGGVAGGKPGGTPGGILGGVLGGAGDAPAIAPPKGPVRVGGDVRQPKIVKIVEPKYPPEARRARVEGAVVLEATVTEQGTVEKIKVISGHPMLIGAAEEAVRNWRYEPTFLNGQPVAVILTARVNFQLAAER
jgi:protein TonB